MALIEYGGINGTKSNMKTCARCGTPFQPQDKEDFCFRCRNSSSAKEAEIIDYLRDHPGVSILEVSQVTKLSKKSLIKMAHEGRFAGLELSKDFGYPCGLCGKLITFGTYCPDCFAILKKDAKNLKDANFMARARQAQRAKGEEDKSRTFSTGMQEEIQASRKK
ncbi:MAG: hypothetical protein IJS81_01465 [Selenomonadaceae bacterium]|nr:hypothetical protein [Selenomonadaceae bacterium]MBQ7628873.1 hypothetical protein [Selenomonadaceae bacterium]